MMLIIAIVVFVLVSSFTVYKWWSWKMRYKRRKLYFNMIFDNFPFPVHLMNFTLNGICVCSNTLYRQVIYSDPELLVGMDLQVAQTGITNNKQLLCRDSNGRCYEAVMIKSRILFGGQTYILTELHDVDVLVKARKLSEQFDETENRFIENIRHDICIPLGNIMRCCELLDKDTPPQLMREFSSIIDEDSYKLLHLIDQALEVPYSHSF
ncbi:MAG: hypothetical protein M0P00_03495 [Bacteroidaceae bacterium]|nr:hypothetical protein [Bacteroidaceae bacterium]